MLSRAGSSRLGLVCSDCGTPQAPKPEQSGGHPLVTGAMLVAMGGFVVLLFFLTNWKPLPAHQAVKQRALIKQITTGEFVREEAPIEKGAISEE